MKSRITGIVFFLLVITIFIPTVCYAHNEKEANSNLRSVLFEADYDLKSKSQPVRDTVDALEAASYLALDQYKGDGSDKLSLLQNQGIAGIPESIADINFGGNYSHRQYTHLGWNHMYTDDKGKWEIRKKILLLTVNKKFDFGLSNELTGFAAECDSFSAVIYYIHVIGDHVSDTGTSNLKNQIGLGGRKDKNDITHELLNHFDILFHSQRFSPKYILFITRLKSLNRKIGKLVNSEGGINTQERFDQYHEYGEELMELLQQNLPSLLKKEEFFKTVFYPDE